MSDIILAFLFEFGGYGLLSIIYAALWTFAIAVVSKGVHPIIVCTAVLAILPFSGVRALTWTVLCLALLVLILRQRSKKWRFAIPALFLLWANLHGSFLIGIAYGAFVVLRERSWKLFSIGLLSLLMTFCTPYGVELYVEIFRTMFDGELRSQINEWQSFALPVQSVPYVLMFIGITVFAFGKRWKEYVNFNSLLLIMSVSSMRMLPIFALLSMSTLQQNVLLVAKQIPKNIDNRRKTLIHVAALAPLFFSMVFTILSPQLNKQAAIEYPRGAVAQLKEDPCNGNLFNSYNYGGYLIWQLPSHKVYIDGRMPSWELDEAKYINSYEAILEDAAFRDQQFQKYSISCVLVEDRQPIIKDLQVKGWDLVNQENGAALLRSD